LKSCVEKISLLKEGNIFLRKALFANGAELFKKRPLPAGNHDIGFSDPGNDGIFEIDLSFGPCQNKNKNKTVPAFAGILFIIIERG
jgi:hypothetical protein